MKPSSGIRRSIVRYRRCGWAISLLVHAALAAGLLAWTFQPWWLADWAARNPRRIQVTMAAGEARDDVAGQATPEVRIVSDPADVTGQLVRNRLDEVVAEAESLSEADKLAQLDALSERLTQVADEGSIQALSGVMQSFLSTKPRATQPAQERPPGDFDFETAQFHDIQRWPKEPDGFRYVTVLLDAAGRTLEVEVSEQEGKPVYETMQRIKANPLLEQVYRQIVMPLLDQLMAGVKQAQAAKQVGPRVSE
ncbi:MAG: hypothetical protein MUE50_22060 [Pirellulaceae bacterium]|nr:hypothetical protein [Pirellulaceae bacterium]